MLRAQNHSSRDEATCALNHKPKFTLKGIPCHTISGTAAYQSYLTKWNWILETG